MGSVTVFNWKKEKAGSVDLDQNTFGVEVKPEIFHTIVRWQLACRRQGTHMTKTRGLVSGGGKKPFKQKGTGNARQGSTRSPLMPGGAVSFGPQPKSYAYTLPKNLKRLGIRMALSFLNKEGRLFVVDQMASEAGKTKEVAGKFKTFGLESAVLIDSTADQNFKRATRNLKGYKYLPVEGMNVFDLLKYDTVVLSKNSLDKVVERCGVR